MKNMYKKYLIFIVAVVCVCTVQAKETIVLNENILKKYMNNEVPSVERINMSYEQSLQLKNIFDERYMFNLSGSIGYRKYRNGKDYDTTNEIRSLSFDSYDGITPAGLNLNKKFMNGTSLLIGTNYDQQKDYDTHNIYDRSNNADLNVQFSIDLWKNFLGYSELAKKSSIDYGINEAEIKRDIELNSFFINIRKMYWALVANEQMIKVYDELIKQAEKDLENTNLKFRSYIADKGDVAKSNANLNSRKANLEKLKIQKQEIIKQLSYLLPDLNDKDVVILSDNFESVLNSLNSCLVNNKRINNYTLYTDYINGISNRLNAEIKSLERYDDMDVNLILGASIAGRNENEFFKAYENVHNRDDAYYNVGLTFNMPLGKTKKNSQLQQTKLLKMEHNSTVNDIKSNIKSVYNNFNQNINYLNNQLKELKNNVYNLDIFVENMKNKYEQGRVSLRDLIEEEDKLLQAKLDIISVENAMINLTLDYLSVFQKAECEFNLKK